MPQSKKYDVIVYIGRFQPLHNGHVQTMRQAAQLAKRVVIIVGSADRPRTPKNPFYFNERKAMIYNAVKENSLDTTYDTAFNVIPNIDTIYDDTAWMMRVQKMVSGYTYEGDKVAIIGHRKDTSSEYLDWFPQWDKVDQELVEPLDATDIRNIYFRSQNPNFFKSVVPQSTFHYLSGFMGGTEYAQIVRERSFLDSNAKQYEHLKYPPTFVTADCVVVQAGHVLLIERRAEPGKGLLAFPGGYLNAKTDNNVTDAGIRELYEETGIKVPEKVLRGSIKRSHVFDHVNRSERGRIITHALFITLSDGEWNLPKVKGSDDAAKAKWIPLSQVKSVDMFEDHFDVLQFFIGGMNAT